MTAPAKQRLHYFDILKGIAIFMVVMGHVLTMCVRGLDRAAIFKFIGEIHMPLFFFISGWFCFKFMADGAVRLPSLKKRSVQLLLPMVAVSSIWIFYFPHSGLQSPLDSTFGGLWHDVWKNGYWFTLVLFEIILLATVFGSMILRVKNTFVEISLTVLVSAALAVVSCLYSDTELLNILSFSLTVRFFPVFMAGAIARRHSDGFSRLTASSRAVTASLLLAGFSLYYICWYWEFPSLPQWCKYLAYPVLHICLAIIAIAVVRPWSEKAFSGVRPSRMVSMWQYIGTQSLAIYLLHYFFLFPLTDLRPVLEGMSVAFVPLFVVSAVVAAFIIAITLGLNYILSYSRTLSLLLTGAMPSPVRKTEATDDLKSITK